MRPLLLNIKNSIPYLILIALYFIFVNLEARKDVSNNKPNVSTKKIVDHQLNIEETNLRISIPVIPYIE